MTQENSLNQTKLSIENKRNLLKFFKERQLCFVWDMYNMPDIDPKVITYKINVHPKFKHVKQKRRKFTSERSQVINKEVNRLENNGLTREVYYPEWLANVVVVKKENG